MQVNRGVLHILDFTTSLAVFAENELPVGKEYVQAYLEGHVEKAFRDPGARTGALAPESPVGKAVRDYARGELSLVAIAKQLGEKAFEYMKQATEPMVMDVIFCEVLGGDSTYLMALFCQAHDGYTHQLFSEEDGSLSTELVEHKAVLPTATQKLRAFFSINTSDLSVRLFEPKGEYDGEVCYVLGQHVLSVGTEPSSRDTVKKVKKIIDTVATNFESDGVKELTMAKEMIAKNAEVSDTVNPVAIIEEVFSQPQQQAEAKKLLEEENMVRPLPVNREFAEKTGRQHKIKTDTGIEISFPVEYMKDRNFIEIVTNPDGTLRIELKSIHKIVNK